MKKKVRKGVLISKEPFYDTGTSAAVLVHPSFTSKWRCPKLLLIFGCSQLGASHIELFWNCRFIFFQEDFSSRIFRCCFFLICMLTIYSLKSNFSTLRSRKCSCCVSQVIMYLTGLTSQIYPGVGCGQYVDKPEYLIFFSLLQITVFNVTMT